MANLPPNVYAAWLAQSDARRRAARRSRLVQIKHDLEDAAEDYQNERIGKWLTSAAKRVAQALDGIAERDGR